MMMRVLILILVTVAGWCSAAAAVEVILGPSAAGRAADGG